MIDSLDFRFPLFVIFCVYVIINFIQLNNGDITVYTYLKELAMISFVHTLAQEHLKYLYKQDDEM